MTTLQAGAAKVTPEPIVERFSVHRRAGVVFRGCAGKKPQDPDLAAWGMVSRPGMSHWPEALRQALPG